MILTQKAQQIAMQAHAGQKRKDGPEYITHPVAVAQMLAERGFSEEVVAAAYVHDVLEDTRYPREQLLAELGQEVVEIVDAVSEDKTLPWEERKMLYIEAIRRGPEGAKAVSVADKIHNLTNLLHLHAERGAAVWEMFNRGKEKKLWFEESMLKMLKESWEHPLVAEYAALVERMKKLD